MYIPIILGTAREGRQSEKAANFMLKEVQNAGIKSEILDVRDFRIEATSKSQDFPKAKKLGQKIEDADGIIIVSPEYNHGYPGELKMMLDMLYWQYAYKPVGLCGVSVGGLGGARMVEQLRQVFGELHAVTIREAIYFSGIQDLFDSNGEIKDKSYSDRVKKFLDELTFYASALKPARDKKGGK